MTAPKFQVVAYTTITTKTIFSKPRPLEKAKAIRHKLLPMVKKDVKLLIEKVR